MDCHEFEQRMNELLDRRCRPECDLALQAHVDHCVECKRVMMAQSQLWASLRMTVVRPDAVNTQSPAMGFAVNRSKESRAPRVARRSRQVVSSLVAGFAVAMVWLGLLFEVGTEDPGKSVPIAQKASGTNGQPNAAATDRALVFPPERRSAPTHELISPDSLRSREGTDSSAATPIGAALPGQVALGLARWDQASLERVIERETGIDWNEARWLTPVQDGLQPLAKSATSTVNVLRLTWPAHRSRKARSSDSGASPSI